MKPAAADFISQVEFTFSIVPKLYKTANTVQNHKSRKKLFSNSERIYDRKSQTYALSYIHKVLTLYHKLIPGDIKPWGNDFEV